MLFRSKNIKSPVACVMYKNRLALILVHCTGGKCKMKNIRNSVCTDNSTNNDGFDPACEYSTAIGRIRRRR